MTQIHTIYVTIDGAWFRLRPDQWREVLEFAVLNDGAVELPEGVPTLKNRPASVQKTGNHSFHSTKPGILVSRPTAADMPIDYFIGELQDFETRYRV